MNEVKIIRRKGDSILEEKTITLPASGEDLSQSQKKDIIHAYALMNKHQAINALAKKWLNTPHFEKIDDAHLAKIIELLQWATPKSLGPVPIHETYKNCKAIAPKFADATNMEYAVADEIYEKITNSKEQEKFIENLHELTALLYRPADKKGKHPALESRDDIYDRLKSVKKWPDEVHLSSLYYFSNVKGYIHTLYGRWLFPAHNEEEGGEGAEGPVMGSSNEDLFGWWGTFLDIAETGVFGNFDQVLRQNFHNTCMYLVQKKRQAEKLKQSNK